MIIFSKVFTVIISRYTVGPTPMNAWLAAFPFRLLMCLALSLFVSISCLVITITTDPLSRSTSLP